MGGEVAGELGIRSVSLSIVINVNKKQRITHYRYIDCSPFLGQVRSGHGEGKVIGTQ